LTANYHIWAQRAQPIGSNAMEPNGTKRNCTAIGRLKISALVIGMELSAYIL
jgi:hypothetical protein